MAAYPKQKIRTAEDRLIASEHTSVDQVARSNQAKQLYRFPWEFCMKTAVSEFVQHLGTPRGNMVKGRRKRTQIKTAAYAKSAVLTAAECNDTVSPVKKESRLNISGIKKIENRDGTCSVSETAKSSICISSFFYTQEEEIKPIDRKFNLCFVTQMSNVTNSNEASTVPAKEAFYGREQQTASIENCTITDVGHFTTDETPVAVPIHGLSTPHRINMPTNQLEDLEEGNVNNEKIEKKISTTLNSDQQLIKRPANRGRRKLNNNQTANNHTTDVSSIKSTNHKLTDFFPVRRSVRKSKKAVLEEKQRDMENKVLCQVEEGLEVRHFAGKGRGVITTREFAKGEFVVEYIGELIDQVTAKKREQVYAQDQNTGCYMYYFQHRNHQYCVDATAETDKLGRLVNHSRNGNLVARVIEVGSTPHLVLTAKEDIPVGTEVTYDYGDRSRESIRHHPWLAL